MLSVTETDNLSSLRSRVAKKLHIDSSNEQDFDIKYDWVGVRITSQHKYPEECLTSKCIRYITL